MTIRQICTMPVVVVFSAALLLERPVRARASLHERNFDLTYTAEVHDIPSGAKQVEIWLPYPQSDDYQKILKANVTSPYPAKIFTDPEHGNKIVYVKVKNLTATTILITMEFTVRRSEHVHNNFTQVLASSANVPPADVQRWLRPDRLVPLDQRIRELAIEVTTGRTTDLEKARAIYDYVLANMKYDKSGAGWGNGDIYWACAAKRGNCTDFHALFIGLARSAGIPAKFEIGLPLPTKESGEIGGYHCWAEFYLNGHGWVPLDASEAWKDPSKREYFFGAHDANRVQFNVGRDLVLAPPQAGPPLNYFIYRYVEMDGKPFTHVSKKFTYRDAGARPTS